MTTTPLSPQHPVVVIGAGLAGWTTVREFRKLDATTPVVLITADSGDFYAKPTLSNAFAQGRAPSQLVTSAAAKMVETLKVTLVAHTQVLAIDTALQVVRTASGDQPYRDLVLATGAQPIHLSLQGTAAAHVLSVNSLDHFSTFFARLTATTGAENSNDSPQTPHQTPDKTLHAKQVLIMGAGLIGCEFANDLAIAGHRVTVVDPSPRALGTLLPAEASAMLQAALSSLGDSGTGKEGESSKASAVQWRLGRTVSSVDTVPGALPGQPALLATLSDGEQQPADVVLSAIGLRADTALAQAAGLDCERGIVVDAHLRTSTPNIYALGDSAQYGGRNGRTLPYVMPIMNAARALAATLAGQATEVKFPLMPVAVKTPALPLMVAPPAPGTSGGWVTVEVAPGLGEWHWTDDAGVLRGFVLAGTATPRRAKLAAVVTL